MYEILQEIKIKVNIIQFEISTLKQTDERSREALELTNDSFQKAIELEKELDKIDSRHNGLQVCF